MALAHTVRAVFFDIDGTLMDHHAAEQAAAAMLYESVRPATCDGAETFCARWRDASRRYYPLYLEGSLSFQDQRRSRVRDTCGRTLSDEAADEVFRTYLDAYQTAWRAYPDVAGCLQRLRHLALGVISNGDGAHQRDKLARMGLIESFRPIVTSGEFGCAKPDRRIFLAACQQAGVEPSQALYVGDDLAGDALAARAAGLQAVWLDRTGQGESHPQVQTIQGLGELSESVMTHR